jgi:pseudouridine-5'-phosphate glycosidase/pseudouridine kinase
MPFPTSLTTAQSVEAIVRAQGAVPATIALLDGRVRVGLSDAELTALADPATPRTEPAVKVSRRDLAPALAFHRAGGTTVAGTMVIAASAGIDAFVTGGIGGVHRGAESSMDVSADLIELGRTPMMVVCAGAKSILDIPRTLEVLETQGVCVVTYGEKGDFPAFYSPSSGCASPWRVGSIGDAASLVCESMRM